MDPGQFDHFSRVWDIFLYFLWIGEIVERHTSTDTERQVKLRQLEIFGHIRIEIVFPVPFGNRGCFAIDHHSGKNRLFDGMLVEYRKSTRKSQTNWTDIAIRLFAKACGTSTEHFAVRLDLAVNLEADGDDVIRDGHDVMGSLVAELERN